LAGVARNTRRRRLALEVTMFTTNPFTPLTAFVSPDAMQGYIVRK
jgi:hypothetical protein